MIMPDPEGANTIWGLFRVPTTVKGLGIPVGERWMSLLQPSNRTHVLFAMALLTQHGASEAPLDRTRWLDP